MKRSIDFSNAQIGWLNEEAAKVGIPVGELVRRIVDDVRIPKRFHGCCGTPIMATHAKNCHPESRLAELARADFKYSVRLVKND